MNTRTKSMMIVLISLMLIPSALFAAETLSAAEEDGILLMREEEKLARDVYLTLYDTWKINTFKNIAGSEQQHMDAMGVIIDRYGLTDPITVDYIGVFTDAHLQQLYDDLVAKGTTSAADAIEVGIMIEELDIKDLEDLLGSSLPSDVKDTYERLLRGSERHLVAFNRQVRPDSSI